MLDLRGQSRACLDSCHACFFDMAANVSTCADTTWCVADCDGVVPAVVVPEPTMLSIDPDVKPTPSAAQKDFESRASYDSLGSFGTTSSCMVRNQPALQDKGTTLPKHAHVMLHYQCDVSICLLCLLICI